MVQLDCKIKVRKTNLIATKMQGNNKNQNIWSNGILAKNELGSLMLIGERKGKKGIGRSSKEGHIYPLSSRQSSPSLASVLPPGPAATRFIFYLSYIITKAKVLFFFFFCNVFYVLGFLSQFDSFINISLFCLFTVFQWFHFIQKFQPILLLPFIFFFILVLCFYFPAI